MRDLTHLLPPRPDDSHHPPVPAPPSGYAASRIPPP
ncbi:hypothetical protein HKBW3S47_02136, partial [Candidatus Hakubella thermalkaliphila]